VRFRYKLKWGEISASGTLPPSQSHVCHPEDRNRLMRRAGSGAQVEGNVPRLSYVCQRIIFATLSCHHQDSCVGRHSTCRRLADAGDVSTIISEYCPGMAAKRRQPTLTELSLQFASKFPNLLVRRPRCFHRDQWELLERANIVSTQQPDSLVGPTAPAKRDPGGVCSDLRSALRRVYFFHIFNGPADARTGFLLREPERMFVCAI
jgi:hypothetical protein